MKTISRKCFLHKRISKPLFRENLDILGLGKVNLTYSICSKCGLIYQSSSPSNKDLNKYYSDLHFNLDNKIKPTKQKKQNVDRYLSLIKQEFKKFPSSVLEVSLMNLYTLKMLKKLGSKTLHGLEPNLKFKNKHFGKIKIFNQTIERFKSNKKYELIILAHVLEHLPNPELAIKNCFKHQNYGQKILIEVPLFDKIELYPLAGFTMEHLHYFSEPNLKYFIEPNKNNHPSY